LVIAGEKEKKEKRNQILQRLERNTSNVGMASLQRRIFPKGQPTAHVFGH
jgi:hypothetical protein